MKRTVHVLGASHKSAPVEERERLAGGSNEPESLVRELLTVPHIDEAVVVSTCNRVELYVAGEGGDCVTATRDFLCAERALPAQWFERYGYAHSHDRAISHLFRVASSLDSLVVGEPQIVGQVKSAFAVAREVGGAGPLLNRTFNQALRTAKRVRTETAIAENAVSVSYAAVELARKVFGDIRNRSVLVIGAGKMGGLALKHLIAAGIGTVHVANRSRDRAIDAASQVGGVGHGLDALPRLLQEVDIVISSTGSQHYIVKYDDVKAALSGRKYRPLFLIDIAVPRDVDPRCDGLQNVYLFDVDDLEKVVEANLKARQGEATRAEHIVHEEVESLIGWMQQAAVVPTIVSLREKLTALKNAEVERILRENPDLPPEARQAVERLAHSLINKVLHEPTASLRAASSSGQHSALVAAARSLFDLEDEDTVARPVEEKT
jgi:glutamyl-tRNA reductase